MSVEDVVDADFRALLPSRADARQHELMRIDPAMGFFLLQGCGRVMRLPRINWRNTRGVETADDRRPLISFEQRH